MFASLRAWLTGASRRRSSELSAVAEFCREARRLAVSGTLIEVEAALTRASSSGGAPDALELEVEMLEGRRDALRIAERVAREGLPIVATQHKALGGDTCHLIAPASLVGHESADTAGKLLLTSRRLLFLGGEGLYLAWSSLRSVTAEARDLLVDTAHHDVHRLRCNTYGEAAAAAVIARELLAKREPPGDEIFGD
jgi:hypothetical protein